MAHRGVVRSTKEFGDQNSQVLPSVYMVAIAGAETDHVFSGWPLHTDLGLPCRAAAKISDGSQYYVLLIITDGVISDMTQTKEAIVSVSLRRKACQGGVTVLAVKGL